MVDQCPVQGMDLAVRPEIKLLYERGVFNCGIIIIIAVHLQSEMYVYGGTVPCVCVCVCVCTVCVYLLSNVHITRVNGVSEQVLCASLTAAKSTVVVLEQLTVEGRRGEEWRGEERKRRGEEERRKRP